MLTNKNIDNDLTVYTDGACKGNPGEGGWGVYILDKGKEKYLKGFEYETTNNRMELLAVIKALEFIDNARAIVIFTDSKYVQQGITGWITNWKKNNWKTSNNKTVKNIDYWKRLDSLVADRDLSWHWVKGHSGDKGNDIADGLANEAIIESRAGSL